MGRYAMMNGDTVTNIIVADDKDDAERALNVTLIEFSEDNPAGIGWTYADGVFTPPVITEDPVI